MKTFYNVVNSIYFFAQSKRVLRSSWIWNERNLSFKIVKNCRIIINSIGQGKTNSVRGLYDQKQAHRHSTVFLRSYTCIKTLIKGIFKRLVYTPPDLSPRFTCKVNLQNTNLFRNTKRPACLIIIIIILAFLLDR